jgi:hypothetical protein
MRALALSVLLALAAVAPSAAAKPESVAMTQFREAKKRYDDGAFQEALRLFQLAWEHSHSPNARLYVARCFKQLGNLVAAYDEFRGTLRDAADKATAEERYEETRYAAAAEIALLEPRIGRLVVAVDAAVEGVEVTIDERKIPAIALGDTMTVVPGTYAVAARAPGKNDVRRNVTVTPGKTVTVSLFFDAPESGIAAPPAAETDDAPQRSTLQIAGWTLVVFGGAALVVAAGTGGAAASKYADLEDACTPAPCRDARFGDVIDGGKMLEITAYAALGIGAAAVTTGAILAALGADDPDEGSVVQTAVVPVRGGAAAVLTLGF